MFFFSILSPCVLFPIASGRCRVCRVGRIERGVLVLGCILVPIYTCQRPRVSPHERGGGLLRPPGHDNLDELLHDASGVLDGDGFSVRHLEWLLSFLFFLVGEFWCWECLVWGGLVACNWGSASLGVLSRWSSPKPFWPSQLKSSIIDEISWCVTIGVGKYFPGD